MTVYRPPHDDLCPCCYQPSERSILFARWFAFIFLMIAVYGVLSGDCTPNGR